MKFILVLFGLSLVFGQECGWDSTAAGGDGVYDFTKLKTDTSIGPITDGPAAGFYQSYLTICGVGERRCDPPFIPGLPTLPGEIQMAQRWTSTGCTSVVGKWDAAVQWSFAIPGVPESGVKMTTLGDNCVSGPSQTSVTFMCDELAVGPPTVAQVTSLSSGISNCDWDFTVMTDAACADALDGGGAGDDGGGLSGGWAFTIFILCFTFVYCVGGYCYKTRQKGTTGVESVPNIDFWRQVPGLVSDGVRFTQTKIQGANYTQVGSGTTGSGSGTAGRQTDGF